MGSAELSAEDWQQIAAAIEQHTGAPFSPARRRPVSGGCINDAIIAGDGKSSLFIKFNDVSRAPLFEAEIDGLAALGGANALRVPRPLCCGVTGGHAWLALECLEFGGTPDWSRFGRELAAQHRCVGERFGWKQDNFIGSTPQPNRWTHDWAAFFRDERLGHQLALAHGNGYRGRLQALGTRLLDRLESLLAGHRPRPSLLHGDLWSGNADFLTDGRPAVFDPAVYHGDREADLAMTELFGGFPATFYEAYQHGWPTAPGYALRRRIYNLYHLLNHLNLFGGGYLAQCEHDLEAVLAQ